MTIEELKDKLEKEGLLNVYIGKSMKQFVTSESVYTNNKWKNMADVFGVYQTQDGEYCFFITDSEKGIPEFTVVCTSEKDACDALMEKISRAERIHKKKTDIIESMPYMPL